MKSGISEVANRYRIIKTLGEGHSAVVYCAEDVSLDRRVALKCAKEGLIEKNPQYRAIFAREAKYLASLDHQNIVPLYDYCESVNGPVIVMRYVQNNLLRVGKQVSTSDSLAAVQVAQEIATALDYCANQGIAHRDVKPDNILVDSQNHLYLTDFGLATPLDNNDNWSQPVGAKPFISPEMFTDSYTGGKADRRSRSDQFSLGVTLYHVLTGRFPHDSVGSGKKKQSSDWDKCTAIRLLRGHPIISCNERNPKIPSQVDQVISRMLSVDPDDRYPTNTLACEAFEEAYIGHSDKDVRVFLSYSRKDKPIVGQLAEYLEKKGLNIWWDPVIEYGVDWEDEVEKALLDSEVLLVVASKQSALSTEVKNEWRYWLNCLRKPLITLIIEECRIPYRLYPRQHIYLQNRSIEEIATEVAAAIRKAILLSQPSVVESQKTTNEYEDLPTESDIITQFTSEMGASNLINLYKLDVEAELKYVSNSGYIPRIYRFDSFPAEFSQTVGGLGEDRPLLLPPKE